MFCGKIRYEQIIISIRFQKFIRTKRPFVYKKLRFVEISIFNVAFFKFKGLIYELV